MLLLQIQPSGFSAKGIHRNVSCRDRISTRIKSNHERVCDAISQGEFSDFENCLQDERAQEASADYTATRNFDNLKCSSVKAIIPERFLQHGV